MGYNVELKKAKHSFYAKKVKQLKSSNSKQWWTQIKKLVKMDNKDEKVEVEEIKHLSDEDQVNIIAQHFAKVSQEYEPLNKDDIKFPPFKSEDIAQNPGVSGHWTGMTRVRRQPS